MVQPIPNAILTLVDSLSHGSQVNPGLGTANTSKHCLGVLTTGHTVMSFCVILKIHLMGLRLRPTTHERQVKTYRWRITRQTEVQSVMVATLPPTNAGRASPLPCTPPSIQPLPCCTARYTRAERVPRNRGCTHPTRMLRVFAKQPSPRPRPSTTITKTEHADHRNFDVTESQSPPPWRQLGLVLLTA